jgi:hypothetical protein
MTACDLSCREQPRAHAVLVTGASVCQLLWCLFGVRAKNAEQFTFYGSASSGEAGAGTGGVALDSEYYVVLYYQQHCFVQGRNTELGVTTDYQPNRN